MINLKRIYSDICLGYTEAVFNGQPIYFKHLNTFDRSEVDDVYNDAVTRALELGLLHEKDALDLFSKRGLWPADKEKAISVAQREIDSLTAARQNLSYPGQLEEINKLLQESIATLTKLYSERSYLIGKTVEDFANQRANTEFIYLSSFLNKDLKTPLWEREHFNNFVDNDLLSPLLECYQSAFSLLTIDNIKKIALEPFFQRPFSLLDNSAKFFDISVFKLTDYQVQLLDYGDYYNKLLEECYKAPLEVRRDPAKLEEFYLLQKNKAEVPEQESSKKTESKWRTAVKSKTKV